MLRFSPHFTTLKRQVQQSDSPSAPGTQSTTDDHYIARHASSRSWWTRRPRPLQHQLVRRLRGSSRRSRLLARTQVRDLWIASTEPSWIAQSVRLGFLGQKMLRLSNRIAPRLPLHVHPRKGSSARLADHSRQPRVDVAIPLLHLLGAVYRIITAPVGGALRTSFPRNPKIQQHPPR